VQKSNPAHRDPTGAPAGIRLNRYLAACGIGSRRQCDAIIRAGRVRVDGEVAGLGLQVGRDARVEVDGVAIRPLAAACVWILHKPAGVVCTARDTHGRPTVIELARRAGIAERVFSVGRLDRDTTGLLLLTNDGDLCFRLTHPAWGVEKEYEATVALPLSEAALAALRQGVQLDDGPTHPCQVQQQPHEGGVRVQLVLHEGRKRQVRRMLAAVGHPVLQLHRTRLGALRLGDLPEGACRKLSDVETQRLLETFTRRPQASQQSAG
jgi:23S rRNA pseudouridine2605 synthase